jgi:hypothetical protein
LDHRTTNSAKTAFLGFFLQLDNQASHLGIVNLNINIGTSFATNTFCYKLGAIIFFARLLNTKN